MKVAIVCLIFVAAVFAEVSISIRYSRVPNVEYEADAEETLREAYLMYPDNQYERLRAFSELFQDLHRESNWTVVESCEGLYCPTIRSYVELVVEGDDRGEPITIRIFN